MASKASKLQSGVHSASRGLFSGMTKLDEQKKDNKPAKEVKETVKAEPEKKAEPVKEEVKPEPVVEKTAEKVAKEQPKVEQTVIEKTVTEPVVSEAPVVEQPKVQQAPVQPQVQTVQQPQIPAYTAPIQQPVYQQPSYNPYTQPVNTMQQMPFTQPVQTPVYNEPKTTVKAEKGEKSSRYEKDKFLLLDIRGLRDYVEHMAKASNMSATKYIRTLIEKDWAMNNDIYMAHKALEEQLRQKNNMR